MTSVRASFFFYPLHYFRRITCTEKTGASSAEISSKLITLAYAELKRSSARCAFVRQLACNNIPL